jgi:hypothetical protein
LNTPAGEVIRFFNNFPAAIIFMLLMGFLAHHTKANSRKLIRRGFKVLFWGLLLNIGLNLNFIIRIISKQVEGQILEAIFAVDILYLAGFSLIIIGIIRYLKLSIWLSLVIAVGIAAISPWMTDLMDKTNPQSYLLAFVGSRAEWSFFPLFPWLSYPIVGYSIAQLMHRFSFKQIDAVKKIVFLTVTLAISSLAYIFNWNDLEDLSPFYHHGIKVFIWGISHTLALVALLSLFPVLRRGGFSAWIQFAGKKLTRYYVIQWLIIGNLASFYYQELGLWAYFLGFVAVSAISTMLVFLLKDQHFKSVRVIFPAPWGDK